LALKAATDAVVVSSGRVSYHGPASELLANQDLLRSSYLG
jgi:branched-chain amino acid transport system ATP-binding protein